MLKLLRMYKDVIGVYKDIIENDRITRSLMKTRNKHIDDNDKRYFNNIDKMLNIFLKRRKHLTDLLVAYKKKIALKHRLFFCAPK